MPSESSNSKSKPSVLFTGAVHARELVTIKMTLSILLKALYGIHHNDSEIISLLKKTNVYIIPILNPDGVAFIESHQSVED